ncbi:MAG: HAD family hydrolase [Rhodospirillales bacterium]|nr:HAD family hydrolase [Rhodospirillales bacterium]
MAFPELIIFDCDGVLVDSELISNRILAGHLSAHGFAISPADCQRRFIGYSMPTLVDDVRAEGCVLPDDFIATLRQKDTAAFAAELQAIAGIGEALTRLPQKKCVASSGPPAKIRANLEHTGLLGFFDPHLYSGSQVARSKPAPDLFFHAAKQFNVAPSACLVIEDSKLGIKAAKAAGMTCFGFTGGGHCTGSYADDLARLAPDLIFDHMRQLPDLVANLAATG